MPDYTIFSTNDSTSPYLAYKIHTHIWVGAGSVAMPLAYQASPPNNPLVTSRILQAAQPTSIVTVTWAGTRQGDKPQPPLVTVPGTFILAEAEADIEDCGISDDGRPIATAWGRFVLYTTARPENIALPSLLPPWDGRYANGTINVALLYTPTDLGFGNLLPGATTSQPYNKITNNPPAQQTNTSFLL